MTVEAVEGKDLEGIGLDKIAHLVNGWVIAHTLRGQARATNKDGEFLKKDDHVYSVGDWLRSYEVGERGSNVVTKEDKEFATKLWEVFSKCETSEATSERWMAMRAKHSKQLELTPWTPEVPDQVNLEILGEYARDFRKAIIADRKKAQEALLDF